MSTPNPDAPQVQLPPQPEAQHIIAALQEELRAASDNRLYLIALLKQLQAEFVQAQELWALERESLKASQEG